MSGNSLNHDVGMDLKDLAFSLLNLLLSMSISEQKQSRSIKKLKRHRPLFV
jgi:hypothetical protein